MFVNAIPCKHELERASSRFDVSGGVSSTAGMDVLRVFSKASSLDGDASWTHQFQIATVEHPCTLLPGGVAINKGHVQEA